MKNLLSHFRRKPSETADAPPQPSEPPKAKAAPIEPVRMQTTVARAIKPAWHAPAAPFPQKQRATALPDRSAATEMITLRLGDFLDRIPAELLDAGAHDRSMPMPFDLAALSERIGRGDTTIRLTEVYRRMPDVFRPDAVIGQERVIPFPWKKVLAMMQDVRAGADDAGITRLGVDALAVRFKARKLRQPSKVAPVPGTAGDADAGSPVGLAKGGETPALTFSLARTDPAPTSPNLAETGRNGGLTTSIMPASAAALEVARLTAERDAALARAAEFGAEYESMIGRTGELTAERDAAVARAAELTAERDAAVARAAEPATEPAAHAARLAELTAERDAALARAVELGADSHAAVAQAAKSTTEMTVERDAARTQVAALTEERDAALARATKVAADSEAAVALAAEITSERDAANGRVEALTAERDATIARGTELTAERDAAVARVVEVTAERDAAVARTAKLVADSEAAVALATELTSERDAATARMAVLNGERDAAAARANEIAAERDAAVARVAELLQISETRPQANSESPATDDSNAAIEGYRNTIEALMRERDALRMEQQQLTARLAERSRVADKKTTRPAAAGEPLPDVYSALFPQRAWMQRAAAALLLGLLGIGVASQTDLGASRRAGAEIPEIASPGTEADSTIPTLTPAAIADGEFTLEPAAAEEAATTLAPETPEIAAPFSSSPNPIVWKRITSRRAR